MTLLLKQIFGFIKLLNSDKGTNQIAAGIACGLILGFSPVFSLQTLLVITLLFFLRIQIGAATVSAFFFAIPAYLLDPVFHEIGSRVLENEGLHDLFVELYHMPIVPLTRFNNSIVMGSGICAVVLAPIVFILSKVLVAQYREKVVSRFEKTAIWKAVKATAFYQWYVKYEELRGN
jgi:uncharacterized protein (TIGR03546 family)